MIHFNPFHISINFSVRVRQAGLVRQMVMNGLMFFQNQKIPFL